MSKKYLLFGVDLRATFIMFLFWIDNFMNRFHKNIFQNTIHMKTCKYSTRGIVLAMGIVLEAESCQSSNRACYSESDYCANIVPSLVQL